MSERPIDREADDLEADDEELEADDEELEAEDDPVGDEDGLGDGSIPQDMVALLEETADLAEPVEVVAGPAGTDYTLGGRRFAWASGLAFEAHVGPEIAAAALRTPDVTPSARGAGWLHLEPAVVDDHAADRVVAWFELARRIAAGRQGGAGAGRRH